MPLYTIHCPDDLLDADARARLAGEITDFHCAKAGLPPEWVHIVFSEFRAGRGFSAGRPAPMVSLTLIIRTGRSSEYKREMLSELWRILQAATGAPDDQIVLGIQEVPASQAMEMAKIMPDVPGD